MIEGTKVVTSEEMQRLDVAAQASGTSPETLMDHGAKSIVSVIIDLLKKPSPVLLLVGRGNNGGDALTIGTILLQRNYPVFAKLVYPENALSSRCKKRLDQFKQAGGVVYTDQLFSLIVDGIVGVGFHGVADVPMQQAIEWANAQEAPILAVDLPSGLDGTTGMAQTAIRATITCCLGLPKLGCFIGQGWDHVGTLLTCDLHLPSSALKEAKPAALLLKNETLRLPPILRSRHKYQTGYVLGIAGSPEMSGAAALASLAALRGGAGIVRLFTQHPISYARFAPEIICETINEARIEEEMERASSLFLGPGLGRLHATGQMIASLFLASTCQS